MPIYEYRCENCGHELEKIQRFSDAALTDCPSCNKPKLKKLMSTAAFQLKGAGWYETDFKHSKKDKGIDKAASDKSDGATNTPAATTGAENTAPKPPETKKAPVLSES